MSKTHPLVEAAIEAFPTFEESGPVIPLKDTMRLAVLAVLREMKSPRMAGQRFPWHQFENVECPLALKVISAYADALIKEIEGEIGNHFADILDEAGDIIRTVSLDAGSYGSLKNHWMRCKVEAPK